MAKIEVDQSLPRHPKTLALARSLKITPFQAIGLLASLWVWVMQSSPSGVLKGVDGDMIAEAIFWYGDGTELLDALIECNFVDKVGDGPKAAYLIHDWMDWSGRLHVSKAVHKKRAAEYNARLTFQDEMFGDTPIKVHPKRTTPMSPCLGKILEMHGAKRFANTTQRLGYEDLERTYGESKLLDAVKWAAEKNLGLGSVSAVRTILGRNGQGAMLPGTKTLIKRSKYGGISNGDE